MLTQYIRRTLKRAIVALATRGIIPMRSADWIVAMHGLRHA